MLLPQARRRKRSALKRRRQLSITARSIGSTGAPPSEVRPKGSLSHNKRKRRSITAQSIGSPHIGCPGAPPPDGERPIVGDLKRNVYDASAR
jgi:hypothetical protein